MLKAHVFVFAAPHQHLLSRLLLTSCITLNRYVTAMHPCMLVLEVTWGSKAIALGAYRSWFVDASAGGGCLDCVTSPSS